MFFTYIVGTTLVIIWLISSNKHLCFYYIDAVNFVTAIPKRDATTGQITGCGKWVTNEYVTQPLKRQKVATDYRRILVSWEY